MSTSRHLLIAVAGLVVIVLLGGAVLVWPNNREAGVVTEQIARLQKKITALSIRNKQVAQLDREVKEAARRRDAQCKRIPTSPQIADLIGRLSQEVDGVTVRDQRFTAGEPYDATIGLGSTVRAAPLTIDMVARFDSVFALIRAVETMDRLVRVALVRFHRPREANDTEDGPLVAATIRLEVIFEPLQVKGTTSR